MLSTHHLFFLNTVLIWFNNDDTKKTRCRGRLFTLAITVVVFVLVFIFLSHCMLINRVLYIRGIVSNIRLRSIFFCK